MSMPRGLANGILGLAVFALPACLHAATPQPIAPWQADPSPTGSGGDEACEPGTATPECYDEAPDFSSFVQSNTSNGGQAARLRTGEASWSPPHGLVLMLALILPFAALQLVLTLPAATWLVLGRREAPACTWEKHPSSSSSESKDDQRPDYQSPWVVRLFFYIGNFMLNVNFTIILPASATTMIRAGGNTFLSGVAIGSYGLGALASLPFVIRLSRRSFKHTLLLMAVVAVLGNAAYAITGLGHGTGAITGLILSRVLCGIEGGAVVMMASGLVHLSSGEYTASAIAGYNFSGCIGLVCGPALSSLSQTCFPDVLPEIPPAAVMIAFAGAYGACVFAWFPSQQDCFSMAGVPDPELLPAPRHEASRPPVQMRASWLFLALTCVQFLVRSFQKVSWEAGVLIVLERQYGLSQKAAGFAVSVPVLCGLPVLAFAGRLNRLGAAWACTILGFAELSGMLLMLQVGRSGGVRQLAMLGVGSAIFYGANWASTVPLAPLRARFCVRGHWALNVEALHAALWATAFGGYVYGPIASRAILGANPSQNLLAASLLLGWVGGFLAMEAGMRVLMDKDGLESKKNGTSKSQ